ncbi:MAG: SUF system NifU family Fe-S cluster assembly protein [Omnitrophica bacterium RIFCSPHIGHO2_02_FULL_49_9]|nr:MAG: SUF system NifU family Fe-S cluster assembly protein [Omnitrophica bacterium RIFCSPHIGHO2_02_FULL_49_9]OGW88140.1 MAG: SUF system NifU family Fe-S cluster assembly protein [Omnitrophica bacterium RIFCSPLOWO2_01_FULL_50_24]
MTDLRDLYQELILDHSKKPCNFRVLEKTSHTAEGYNPLCGDRYTVYLNIEGGVISDISFQGAGCAISKASASMMTSSVKGKTIDEANMLFEEFHRMICGNPGSRVNEAALGKLVVFSGVCEFPIRVKCASLAWHTMKAGMEKSKEPVSTE